MARDSSVTRAVRSEPRGLVTAERGREIAVAASMQFGEAEAVLDRHAGALRQRLQRSHARRRR